MASTKLTLAFGVLLPFVQLVVAQSKEYGQCGGTTWTGPKTCVPGWTCTYSNPYYSQCLPATSSSSSSTSTFRPTSSTRSSTSTTASSTTRSSTATTPSSSVPAPTSTSVSPGLDVLAKLAGKYYFGSATDNGELTDQAYFNLLSNSSEFGQLTPGNSMKWDATEPSRGTFTFSGGDQIVNVARKSQQLIRGHTCVWHNQLPAWLTNGKWSKDELLSIVETHCSTLVGHYKGYIYSWDVANELFDDSGVWRNAPFYGITGPDFVATALRAAAAADPATRLYINDYNLEYPSAKSSMLAALAKNLTTAGVPLDGIGFQGHLISGSVPPKSTLIQQMELFTSLGLEVAFTELDIRITLPVTAAKLAQQKIDYQTVVSACMAVEGCIGITIWDYTDKYSWIPGVFPGEGAALPWDENLVKKPAYDGIMTALTA